MHKQLCRLLIGLLLAVQTAALLHMAEHVFCKHTHQGKVCEIELVVEKGKAINVPLAALEPLGDFLFLKSTLSYHEAVHLVFYSFASPRAPPVLS